MYTNTLYIHVYNVDIIIIIVNVTLYSFTCMHNFNVHMHDVLRNVHVIVLYVTNIHVVCLVCCKQLQWSVSI